MIIHSSPKLSEHVYNHHFKLFIRKSTYLCFIRVFSEVLSCFFVWNTVLCLVILPEFLFVSMQQRERERERTATSLRLKGVALKKRCPSGARSAIPSGHQSWCSRMSPVWVAHAHQLWQGHVSGMAMSLVQGRVMVLSVGCSMAVVGVRVWGTRLAAIVWLWYEEQGVPT